MQLVFKDDKLYSVVKQVRSDYVLESSLRDAAKANLRGSDRHNSRKGSRKSSSRGSYRTILKPDAQNSAGTKNSLNSNFYQSSLSKKVINVLDGVTFSLCVSVVTLYVLVADDIRQWLFPPSADLGFTIANLFCMAVFFIEMILLSLFKEGYFLRFYFWLDIISLITMVFDLMWINDMLSLGNYNKAASVVKMVRAGRASKIGSRSARLIRIIRLIRILRLYKNASANIAKNQNARTSINHNQNMEVNSFNNNNHKNTNRQELAKENNTILINSNNSYPAPPNSKDEAKQLSTQEDHIFQPIKRFPSKANNLGMVGEQTIGSLLPNEDSRLKTIVGRPKLPPIKQEMVEEDEDAFNRTCANPINPFIANRADSKTHFTGPDNVRSNPDQNRSQEMEIPTETKVGIKLKDEIQKNIILMVILILISVPMFSTSVWVDMESAESSSIYYLQYFSYGLPYDNNTLDLQIRNYISFGASISTPLVYFYYPVNTTCCEFPTNYPQYQSVDLSSLRGSSLTIVNYDNVTAIFDDTPTDVLTAQLSLGRTIFICLLLIIASLLFARDVEEHALQPLENMYNTVKKITKDPLKAIIAIENQALLKDELQMRENVKTEPIILENMIIKIGSLLVVGFGEAGSEMISKNIQSYGALNAQLQGRKVVAIFGFCDIRNFTDATEILQTKVMNFVNDIAAIVHGTVNRYAGSANKNIGDAFLLVWKFGEKETITSQKDGNTVVTLRKISKVRQIADLAIFSFVKIIAQTNKSHTLLKYKNNQKLQARIKNYKGVTMGFGLHVGWAIEGGIGSQFKIDASYLSPNVNMASRLQAATKQFGTSILITGDLADLMTPGNKKELRKIDKVGFAGNEEPLDLYTIDLNVANLVANITIRPKPSKTSDYDRKKQKTVLNRLRQNLLQKLETSKKLTESIFNDKDYKLMKAPYTPEFYEIWEQAYALYSLGEWQRALPLLQKTETMLQKIVDGPSKNLINVIKKLGTMPEQGYRDFIEK